MLPPHAMALTMNGKEHDCLCFYFSDEKAVSLELDLEENESEYEIGTQQPLSSSGTSVC